MVILKKRRSTDESLLQVIEKALDTKGVLYKWASEDYRSKRPYDITTDSATLSTIHSAKGFDYSRVFLIGLDLLDPAKWSEAEVRSLVYIGIPRARYELFIPFINKSYLVDKLLACL